eukprot:SAG25_NODE_10443_length_334_cov_0.863830_1_plen_25_part_01
MSGNQMLYLIDWENFLLRKIENLET